MKDFYFVALIGFALSLALTCLVMPFYIQMLKNHHIAQSVSEYALDEYKNKQKTPIMGGLIFVLVPVVIYLIVNGPYRFNMSVLMVICSYMLFCLVGFLDDILIILRGNNEGLSPRTRLIMEFVFVILIYAVFRKYIPLDIHIPFTGIDINLPWFIFLPFMILLYMAEANAVNFTDGMDGLCAGVSFIALIPLAVIAFVKGYYSLVLLIVCVLGGLIGYLVFNHHPAKIFMGDSGSLALGALFTASAIILKCEVALFVVGGVFVVEMFCVCVQQISVRLFHKRVFSYTPIHYAFTLKGMKETKVVGMFYLLQLVLSIVGLIIGLY